MAAEVARPTGRTRAAHARTWPTWRVVAVVAAAYACGALLAFAAFGATAIVVLFLPAGVTLSALVLTPTRQWPWILAAVAATEILIDVSHGQSPRFVWGFALANTAEPLVGAWLLRRFVPGRVDLLRRRDLSAFLACCVVAGPLVGGLFGATTISWGLERDWFESFLPFWAGDATGVLTVGGCVLAFRHRPRAGLLPAGRWALAVAATVAVTALGFWPVQLPLFYLPIPVLFWLAFSQPLLVALSCGLAMTVTANVLTSAGHGPWAALEGPVALRTATLQLFLGVALLGAWFLAVGAAERDSARRAAHQLQHALLPVLPGDPSGRTGIRVTADYRPAERAHDVGGDWYDVFTLPGERIGLVVGDVVGHDLTAAAAMARVQSVLRIVAQSADGPARVLEELDRASVLITDSFMTTVGYADYDPATRLLRYACAGHLPPLLLTRTGTRYLWGGRSAPLGIIGAPRPQAQCAVPAGSTLIWYTDGLVERDDVPLPVSLDQLAAAATNLHGHDPDDLCRGLLRRMSSGDLRDDTVVLCVRFAPEGHSGVATAVA
ncbi:SpoIIE family protein phosphatase [Actinomycetes bacterium KLBMP 9797]